MCTAATYKTKDFYFGRTLDYEVSYGDEITITPRNYEFKFKETEQIKNHYAIIGMAYVAENYPLYYDAINEKGLGIAGLNFVGNTHYSPKEEEKDNITQYEFIPWILSQCTTVKEARQLIEKMNFLDEPFNGLDESSAEKIRKLLLEEKEKGKIIILATHIKEDIDTLCDVVYKVDGGKIEKM